MIDHACSFANFAGLGGIIRIGSKNGDSGGNICFAVPIDHFDLFATFDQFAHDRHP